MKNFTTITLIHNQEKNLERVLNSYSLQTLQPDLYIFVLDRCIDNSKNILETFSERFPTKIVENVSGNGFLAGYCRDLGLSYVKNSSVLFLDGDCVPTEKIFEENYKVLNTNEKIITISKRICEQENGDIAEDPRILIPWFKDKIFKKCGNYLIEDMYLSRGAGLTWSCCLGLNFLAINLIKNIIKNITGEFRLFNPIFDNKYGCEDDYIGYVAMLFSIPIVSINPENFVKHIWHIPKTDFPNNVEIAKSEFNKLSEFAIKNNATGLKFLDINFSQYVREFISNMKQRYETTGSYL